MKETMWQIEQAQDVQELHADAAQKIRLAGHLGQHGVESFRDGYFFAAETSFVTAYRLARAGMAIRRAAMRLEIADADL